MPESVSKRGAGDPPFSEARGFASGAGRPASCPARASAPSRRARRVAVSVRAAFAMVRHPFDQIPRRPVGGNRPFEHLLRGPVEERSEPPPFPRRFEKPLADRILEARPDLLAP